MIKDAYKETLKMLKVLGQIVIVLSVAALAVLIPTVPTYWLIETYFNTLFCAIVGTIVDFVLSNNPA